MNIFNIFVQFVSQKDLTFKNKCFIIIKEQTFFKEELKMSEKLTIEERKRIIDEIINDMLDLRHKQDVNPACEFASISEKK